VNVACVRIRHFAAIQNALRSAASDRQGILSMSSATVMSPIAPRKAGKPQDELPFSPTFLITVFAVLLVIMAASFWGERQASLTTDMAYDTQARALETAEILSTLQDAELGQRGYLLAEDEDFLTPYNAALTKVGLLQGYLADLRRNDPTSGVHIDRLQSLITQRLELLDQTLDLAKSGKKEEAIAVVKEGRGKDIMDEIRAVISEINTTRNELLDGQNKQRRNITIAVRVTEAVGFLFLLVTGITVLRQTTATVVAQRKARDAANDANKAKSSFLASMSHELRTPMTGIIGMCDLLLTGQQTPEDRRTTQLLARSAQTLLNLLNDILDLSKIEAGRLTLECVHFRLTHILEETDIVFGPIASQKGLLLKADKSAMRLDVFQGDPKRLQQVIFNLVSNAIKFTAHGSVNVLCREEREAGSVKIWLVIEVSDTGVGISEEAKARLFQEFEQEDSSTTRQFGGTGLGLSISRRLVHAMGGTIGVESAKGVGSNFFFRIPLREGDAASVVSRSAGNALLAADQLRGMRLNILVAEDTPTTQHLIATMLTRWGHEVRTVVNGLEAVAAAEERAWDIILMDMQMPLMDGAQAVAAIRSGHGPSAGVPIIALTADAIQENHPQYLEAGSNLVATKPIDWQLLARQMSSLVAPHRNAATAATPNTETAASSDQNTPLFDRAILDELHAALGTEMLASLMPNSVKALDSGLVELKEAIGGGDMAAVKRIAHRLTGVAGQCGAARAGELTRKIEVDATSADDARALLSLLEPSLADIGREIDSYIAEQRAKAPR